MDNDVKHMVWMALACGIPMLILLLLPLFGIQGNLTWYAIGLMVVLHLWMMKDMFSGKKADEHTLSENDSNSMNESKKKGGHHGCH